jgi:DNA transformation protein
MAVQAQYLAYVLEQLTGVERVSSRRMFGGIGLYSGDLFFGLIDDDTLFFKTGESNYAEYQARRMPRFMPPANRPLGPMGYHQVPAKSKMSAAKATREKRRPAAPRKNR